MIAFDRRKLIRWLSLGVYFVAVFLAFLTFLFPYGRVKTRLESEVRARTPCELSIGRIAPRFLNRYVFEDVVLSSKSGAVLFESPSVRTHVSLFALLRGALAVRLAGKAYGGELLLAAEYRSAHTRIDVDADNLDIGSYTYLRNLGYKVSGKAGGTFELDDATGKGRVWFKNLATRELKVKGFPVPDFDFEQGLVEAEVKGDRLSIRKLELDGKELKVRVTGDLVMRERGTLNLIVKLKPSERLAHEQAGLLSFLKNKDAEGYYQFSLGGTVNEPMPRL